MLAAGALFAQAPAFEVATIKQAAQITPAQMMAGQIHVGMTIDAARKSAQALRFFSGMSGTEGAAFLTANGIDYVLVTDPGFVERLSADPSLRLTDHEGEAALFRVAS